MLVDSLDVDLYAHMYPKEEYISQKEEKEEERVKGMSIVRHKGTKIQVKDNGEMMEMVQ